MAADYEKRLLRVLDYIYANPAGDLSLDTLADVAAMSRFHWHRVFHGVTGETCAQATRRIRLHRAACWLVQTDWALSEIAKRCGYPNQQSFNKVFSGGYGLTPGAFRNRGELRPPLLKPKKGKYPMYPIEISTQPARTLASIPHKGAYLEIGSKFEQLAVMFTSRDLWASARGMVGVYYDDPNAVAEEELSSVAGVVVEGDIMIDAPMQELQLPEGRYAVMHYKGPYSGLKAAYDYAYGEWLPKSGEETGDHPPIEVYLNNPADTAPEDLLTDVCVPLR